MNTFGWFLIAMTIFSPFLCAVTKEVLVDVLTVKHPFNYPLGIELIPFANKDAGVMICCHGYGGDHHIVETVEYSSAVKKHLIGFNFPDYRILQKSQLKWNDMTFGSVKELMPLLYLIKKCVIDAKLTSIDLYGFSAGGAAVVNLLVILNHSWNHPLIKNLGIDESKKNRILEAIQNGMIILDCPLKSVEEVIDSRGSSPDLEIMASRYKENNLRPIDSLMKLNGLNLNIIVHFQQPDEILSNRDDDMFIERLKEINQGSTKVVIGHEGGHNTFHASLWKAYTDMLLKKTSE